jgi:hypothetical protein
MAATPWIEEVLDYKELEIMIIRVAFNVARAGLGFCKDVPYRLH